MLQRLNDIMSSAGLGHLMTGGKRMPYEIVASLMSKNKDNGYKKPGLKPFSYEKLDNPSEDIQRKYGSDEVKPFDYCKAQRRCEEEEKRVANLSPEERNAEQLEELVKTPEYWGLEWKDLTREGNWFSTPSGLRFPPVKWINPVDKKAYWALASGSGLPEGDVKYNKKKGEVVKGKRQRVNYEMLYFKDKLPPNLPKRASAVKKDTKTMNGVKLMGTNQVRGNKGNISTGLSEEKKDSILPLASPYLVKTEQKKIEEIKEEKKEKKETLNERIEKIRKRIDEINDALYVDWRRWDYGHQMIEAASKRLPAPDMKKMMEEMYDLKQEKEQLGYKKEELEAELAGKKAYAFEDEPVVSDPFAGMSTQDIKDELHRLSGHPERVGQKNTPKRYGSTNAEIKANVLKLREEARKAKK